MKSLSFEEYCAQCENDELLKKPLDMIAKQGKDEKEKKEKKEAFLKEKYNDYLKRTEATLKEERKKKLGVFSSPPKQVELEKSIKGLNAKAKPKKIKQVDGQISLLQMMGGESEKKKKKEGE